MKEKYPVILDGNPVGYINAKRTGLYMLFEGRFTLESNRIWRIIARAEDSMIDLGICLFEKPCFILQKRLPVKLFSDSDYCFEVIDAHTQKILEDRPFDDLDKIERGRAVVSDGLVFVPDSDH